MVLELCTALGANRMGNNRLGFTLMEIMVVVVIIAVLASVAGPMIGDIVNQGKASATRSKLAAIKSAIVTYKNDVGRYPYFGERDKISVSSAYDQEKVLTASAAKNVLVKANVELYTGDTADIDDENKPSKLYGKDGRKWKGPYMDSDPADFMIDAWGKKIRYMAYKNSLILWSAGPDGEFDFVAGSETGNKYIPNERIFNSDAYAEGETDDLYISIARFRKEFDNTYPAYEEN